MKALRLPICAAAIAYLVRFRRPRVPPVFVFAVALLKGGRPPSGPGNWVPADWLCAMRYSEHVEAAHALDPEDEHGAAAGVPTVKRS
jgi:hypothetical protein